MPFEDPSLASLPILLLRSRVAVAGLFNRLLRQHGLTEQQWRILRALDMEGDADVKQLGLRCDLLPPSVSRIIRDLEMRALVIRSAGQEDARRTVATATPEGRQLIAETMNDITGIHAEIDRSFGKESVRDLRLRLTDLIASLQRQDGQDVSE